MQGNLGNVGENIAANFLKDKGYKILEKNFEKRVSFGPQTGEIDIIAKKDGIICFIEVKTLAFKGNKEDSALFLPEDKVNFLKQRKIIKTAQSWLIKNKISLESKWQIDVVSILINLEQKKAKIRHFENAVS